MMVDYNYKINIRLKNTKPVQLKDIAAFFEGMENEYRSNLGKKFNLNIPDCETNLAIAEVRPGSQIFTLVALVASDCLFPHLNQQILLDFYNYITVLLADFSQKNNDEKINQYTKKNCQNVQNIAQLYQKDFNLEVEMNICENDTELKKVKISTQEGRTIYKHATAQIIKYNEIKNNSFENRLLYFYQTQNSTKSAGDKVIIGDFSDKAKKIEFATPALKQKIIGTEENFFKHLYRASGYVNYQDDKIKSYTVTSIEKINNEAVNE